MNFGIKVNSGGRASSVATGKVTQWIQIKINELGYLNEDGTMQILVQEMECTDPDCVPLEVLVALLGINARWTTKILKPLNDVTLEDIEEITFPGSWSLYVENYREYGLKKTQIDLYEQIQALSSHVDDCVIKLTMNERMALTTMLQRIINKVQLPLPAIDTESGVPTKTMPSSPSSSTTFVPMMFKSSSLSSESNPSTSATITTNALNNDVTISSGSSNSSSRSSSNSSSLNNNHTIPPPTSPPPTIPPPAPPTYPKPASLPPTFSTSSSAAASTSVVSSSKAPPSRRHDKGM